MISRQNNFDLIRLTAAISVLCNHIGALLTPATSWIHAMLYTVAQLLPGVPIFFVTSGFLITNSLLERPNLYRYAKARFLRIYPAFVASTLLTSVILYALGYWNFTWFINQFTIIWLYGTPMVTVPFGGGMPNGPLWTIPVEVKFYLLLPLLLWPLYRGGWSRHATAVLVGGVMAISAILVLGDDFGQHHRPDLRHGIFHHFWFFGFGVLARLYWAEVQTLVTGRAAWWLAAHAVLVGALFIQVPYGPTRILGALITDQAAWTTLALALSLPGLVLAAAFTLPALTQRWLRGNDLSYGTYIYQTPYIHLFQPLMGSVSAVIAVLVATGATAWASWRWIEKPALRLK